MAIVHNRNGAKKKNMSVIDNKTIENINAIASDAIANASQKVVHNLVQSVTHVGTAGAVVGGYVGSPLGPVGAVIGATAGAVVGGGAAGIMTMFGMFGRGAKGHAAQQQKQVLTQSSLKPGQSAGFGEALLEEE